MATAALALACGGAGVAVLGSGPEAAPDPTAAASQSNRGKAPNVIFIYSDDQDERTFTREYMPRTFRLLVDRGTVFTDAMTATPVCCPSRAGYLSGQYPHNNGVFSNNPGYKSFKAPENNLAAWMSRAGYRTGWVGKFLQGYDEENDLNRPAPGFRDWAVTSPSTYFGFELLEKNKTSKPRSYLTDVQTREATQIIRRGGRKPLFLTVNYLAPHKDAKGQPGRCKSSAAPAPRDLGSERGLKLPMPESFGENTRDKRLYPPKDINVTSLTKKHRCRVESLRALDRGIEKIHSAVKKTGEIDNTIFVFTSDNGLLLGEHDLEGKGKPYEEGLQVPFAMRVPPRLVDGQPVASSNELVANIDIAPTILKLAGAKPCITPSRCRRLDGRSLMPLIEGRDGAFGGDRAVLIEGSFGSPKECDFRGIRTSDKVFLQRARGNPKPGGCTPKGEPEVYDLSEDPFQLDNLGVTDPQGSADLRRDLRERLDDLERCSGISGRDPNKPSPFCG